MTEQAVEAAILAASRMTEDTYYDNAAMRKMPTDGVVSDE